MDISIKWLNDYFAKNDPTVTTEEAGEVLTALGFPVEGITELPNGDTCVDFELTSNRGDCACHIGFAREIAAKTGRTLILPEVPAAPGTTEKTASDFATVEIEDLDGCPRYTGWVIKNCKIGPSPSWLVERLVAIGLRSINNAVDITNFVLHELGQPTHVFDMKKLRKKEGKPAIIVRRSSKGEKLTTLDGNEHELPKGMLVIADAERPVALAGVMGGLDTEVDETTVDILLEAATFNPLDVRICARRLKTSTDSSYRFERIVEPRTVEYAARRCATLIAELTGGTLLQGFIDAGKPLPQSQQVTLRCQRCRDLLGINVSDETQKKHLQGLGLEPVLENGRITCTIPPHRTDLYREVDLIEEVARMENFDCVPIHNRLQVVVHSPQSTEQAKQRIREILTGLGYYETITFTFVSKKNASPFLENGMKLLQVEDERRKAEPYLRPSLTPSLMHCRRSNQNSTSTDIRLFELAATFARVNNKVHEKRVLSLLADAQDKQDGLRSLRTAVEAVVRDMSGENCVIEKITPPIQALDSAASGRIIMEGKEIGTIGLINKSTQDIFDLDKPVAVAELDLDLLTDAYPPSVLVKPLPQFPHIERDLSLLVDEELPWSAIEDIINKAKLEYLESYDYVTTFRGKQIGAGKKSVTLRLRFRDDKGTLRHEQVDPQAERLTEALINNTGAVLRK